MSESKHRLNMTLEVRRDSSGHAELCEVETNRVRSLAPGTEVVFGGPIKHLVGQSPVPTKFWVGRVTTVNGRIIECFPPYFCVESKFFAIDDLAPGQRIRILQRPRI